MLQASIAGVSASTATMISKANPSYILVAFGTAGAVEETIRQGRREGWGNINWFSVGLAGGESAVFTWIGGKTGDYIFGKFSKGVPTGGLFSRQVGYVAQGIIGPIKSPLGRELAGAAVERVSKTAVGQSVRGIVGWISGFITPHENIIRLEEHK